MSTAKVLMSSYLAQCFPPEKANLSLKGYANADADRKTYATLYAQKCITKPTKPAAATAAPTPTIAPCLASPSEVYFCDKNIPSAQDYGSATKETKWEDCALRCWKDEACRGWSWSPAQMCQLKKNGEKTAMIYQKEYRSGPRRDMSVGGGGGAGTEGSSSSSTPSPTPTSAPVSGDTKSSSSTIFMQEAIAGSGITWWMVIMVCIVVTIMSGGAMMFMMMM